MSKARMAVLFVATVFMIGMAFNNCGKVDFQKVGPEAAEVVKEAAVDEQISEDEINQIVDQLPAGELDIVRPVSELESNPDLFEVYKCGEGGHKVLICHLSDGLAVEGGNCISRSAVETHYSHLLQYVKDGVNKEIGDYLGPCRASAY